MKTLKNMNIPNSNETTIPQRKSRIGITIVSLYCIIAGLAEIWVGITGNWMGILSTPLKPSFWTALIGIFYVFAGISLLPKKKWGAILGIAFIVLEILARVNLVLVGIYPSHGVDLIKSIIGATIALALIIYLITQWEKFDRTDHAIFLKRK